MTTIDPGIRPTTITPDNIRPGDSFRVFERTYTAQSAPYGYVNIQVRDHENRIDTVVHIPGSVKVRLLDQPAIDRVDLGDLRIMNTVRITRHDGTAIVGVVRAVDESHVTIAQKFQPNTRIGRRVIQSIEILN